MPALYVRDIMDRSQAEDSQSLASQLWFLSAAAGDSSSCNKYEDAAFQGGAAPWTGQLVVTHATGASSPSSWKKAPGGGGGGV